MTTDMCVPASYIARPNSTSLRGMTYERSQGWGFARSTTCGPRPSALFELPAEQPVFDRFQAQRGDPELLRPVIGVERHYLEAALDEMGKEFGSIEGYFAEGLGLDAAAQGAVRAALLESS